MQKNKEHVTPGGIVVLCLLMLNAIALKQGLVASSTWYFLLIPALPLLVASIINMKQRQF